jgi:hypothetical protein
VPAGVTAGAGRGVTVGAAGVARAGVAGAGVTGVAGSGVGGAGAGIASAAPPADGFSSNPFRLDGIATFDALTLSIKSSTILRSSADTNRFR